MKTKFFTSILILVLCSVTYSQTGLVLYPAKPDNAKHGISKNLTYSTIISTTLSKKDLTNKIITFLKVNDYLDMSKNKIEELNENLSELNLNLGYTDSYFNGAGMMGMKYMRAPITFYFKANIKINAEGQIAFTVTDFYEESFELVTNGIYAYEQTSYDEKQKKVYNQLMELYLDEMEATSLLNKAFLIAESFDNPESVKKYLKEKLERKQKADQLFESAVKNKIALFVSDNDLPKYFDPKMPYRENTAKAMTERFNSGFLFSLDNDRWHKRIEPNFNDLFITLSKELEGKMEGIALDGKIKYKLEKDKLKKVK